VAEREGRQRRQRSAAEAPVALECRGEPQGSLQVILHAATYEIPNPSRTLSRWCCRRRRCRDAAIKNKIQCVRTRALVGTSDGRACASCGASNQAKSLASAESDGIGFGGAVP
jgi:hypothetical protein